MKFKHYFPSYRRGQLPSTRVWFRRFLEKAYKNISLKGVSRNYNFYTNNMATYSGVNNVTYYYTFDELPTSLPISYREEFRAVAEKGVRVNFIDYLDPTRIDWNSPAVKNKINIWGQISQDFTDINEFTFQQNLRDLDNNEWRKRSLVYLSGADIRRGRRLFTTRTLMIVTGIRGKAFDDSVESIEEITKLRGIKSNRVTENIESYLKGFSPTADGMVGQVVKDVGNVVLPDEIISRFSGYDQGKIGKRGIIWGNDIYSGFPVLKEVKKTSESPENWFITAPTGGGKSYLVKFLTSQLNADPRFYGTIMDIEGFEYIPMAKRLNDGKEGTAVVLNMAEGVGLYYDPMEIVLVGEPSMDNDMLKNASNFSVSLLQLLVGTLEDDNAGIKDKWLKTIIKTVVSNVYRKAGVTPEMKTWGNSKGLTLHDCYYEFKEIYQEVIDYPKKIEEGLEEPTLEKNLYLNKGYIEVMDLIFSQLRSYFETFENGGVDSGIFSERVTFDQVVKSKLLICSFGLAGKNEKDIDPVKLSISQSYAAYISHIRSMYAKANGKYNYKLWEEFQRWGRMPGSESILNTTLTGGRKNGDVNIVVTNKVSDMLGDNDKFGIFQNTQSFAIGGIDDSRVRKELAQSLSIGHLQFELDKLVKDKKPEIEGVKTVSSIYDYGFLVKLDSTFVTLLKVNLPEEIMKSDIFRTGVNLEG